jgi:Uma2 family endonuclease
MAGRNAVASEAHTQTAHDQQSSSPEAASVVLLPLENGDHLTRQEFERRYQARPDLKKAELIEGVVYMPSPVRFKHHGEPHGHIMTWLGVYCAATPGVGLGDNVSVRLDLENEVQLLRLEQDAGGHSHISADDYIEGAPELIVEVAASSASYDKHEKLRVYRRNGVQEYLVWQVADHHVEWFHLTDGAYIPLTPDASGVLTSQMFPGLRLLVPALLDGDIAQVLAELQNGLNTADHAAFVKRLAEPPQIAR